MFQFILVIASPSGCKTLCHSSRPSHGAHRGGVTTNIALRGIACTGAESSTSFPRESQLTRAAFKPCSEGGTLSPPEAGTIIHCLQPPLPSLEIIGCHRTLSQEPWVCDSNRVCQLAALTPAVTSAPPRSRESSSDPIFWRETASDRVDLCHDQRDYRPAASFAATHLARFGVERG